MRFPWRWVLVLLMSILVGAVAYDVGVHKGFKHSQTREWLSDAGVLIFLEQVAARVQLYGGKALDWISVNVPVYYAWVCEVVGPYLTLFWNKLYELGLYIAEATKPHRAWLNQKVPELLEWIQSKLPWLQEVCSYYLSILWNFTLTYSVWLWQHIVHYWNIVSTWMLTNVFVGSMSPENLWRLLSDFLTAMQSYTSAGIRWCGQMINGQAVTAN